MTKQLLELDGWDSAAIDARQRELGKWVQGIWTFPGEKPLAKTSGEAGNGEAQAEQIDMAPIDELPEVPP